MFDNLFWLISTRRESFYSSLRVVIDVGSARDTRAA